jgi:hypothetical protein
MQLEPGWRWEDPRWREVVGVDRRATLEEAIRRGIDLRDTLARAGSPETSRAVLLLDVLNHLYDLPG